MKKNEEIKAIASRYFSFFPNDREFLTLFDEQINEDCDICDRSNFVGHVVANSLILYDNKVLTIFHNFLQMYLQPWGHVDEWDVSVLDASLREAKEETGIDDLVLYDWHKDNEIPIYIESHFIPENMKKQEEQHYHHDFMYAFKAQTDSVALQFNEVSDFSWIDIEVVLRKDPDSFVSKSLKRMIELGLM